MSENLDSIMRKVRGLIANADDPATPPAAAVTFREKAEALMFKYKIESLTAAPEQRLERPTPVWKTFWVCRDGNLWRNYYAGIAQEAMHADDIRYKQAHRLNEDDGYYWIVYEAVGYESDLAYAEILMTSAIQAFGRNLEPTVDPTESDAANALRLRRGGMERRRIAMALFGGWETENEMKAKNRKVTKLIKEEATRIGQPELVHDLLGRTGSNIATYRTSYASGFYWTLHNRMRTKKHQDANAEQSLVLATAAHAVEEAFYERYPNLRPKASVESSASTKDKCEKCAKTKSGYCREHQWMRPSRARYRETAYSSAGSAAGSAAARSVDLGSSGPSAIG